MAGFIKSTPKLLPHDQAQYVVALKFMKNFIFTQKSELQRMPEIHLQSCVNWRVRFFTHTNIYKKRYLLLKTYQQDCPKEFYI